jgi:homoserine kinase
VDNIAALLGGLSSGIASESGLTYRSLPVSPFRVVIVLPEVDDYPVTFAAPDVIPFNDAAHNLRRLPLLLDGFRSGDLKLITQVLDDRLVKPRLQPRIPGYNHVRETARLAGALGVTISGDGPALVALAAKDYGQIADAMVAAFDNAGVKARAWIVPIDTQGVVISAVQSS